MKENFIDTLVVNSKIYVFRFVKDGGEGKYLVSLVSKSKKTKTPSFIMASHPNHKWEIEGEVTPEIQSIEKLLSDLIESNN